MTSDLLPQSRRKRFALTASLVLVSLFLGLGSYDLSAPDEPRFALVAREMLKTGDWFMPHRNGQPYPDKPPLFFWAIATATQLLGGEVTAWSARLPSALAAFCILVLTFVWANKKSEDDTQVAWVTVITLLTTFRFVLNARSAQIDMLLCLCTTLSLVLGFPVLNGNTKHSRLLGTCLGLGILAKGPVGYLVPVGSWITFCLFRRSFANFPLKALLWGLLPPLIWLFFLNRQVLATGEWDYFNNLLFKQTITRAVNPWHHHQPWYYFLVTYLHDGLPWSFLLIAAIPFTRNARSKLDDHQCFAWATVFFTIFMFSLSSGKRSVYILPLYPFAAFLVASFMVNTYKVQPKSWRLKIPMLLCALLLFLVGISLLVVSLGLVPLDIPERIENGMPSTLLAMLGATLCLIILVCLLGLARSRMTQAFQTMVLAMILLHVIFYSVVLPIISPYRSARPFTEKATEIIRENDQTPMVGMVVYRSAYRFYGAYPLVELATNEGYPNPCLDNPLHFFKKHPNGWLIVRSHHWEPYQTDIQKEIWISMEVGRGEVFYLIGPSKAHTD